MLRNYLLDNGYHFEIIEPKKRIINLLWVIFALLFIIPVILLYFLIFSGDLENILNIPLFYIDLDGYIINIMFIMFPVLYFILKEIITVLFRVDPNKITESKLYADTEIPITAFREAFKTWQIILIYMIPMIIVYPLLILLSIISGENANIFILNLIMSFFMSFDLTLVIYVLFLKIK